MINLQIPSFGALSLKHLVLDYNGTLAQDGVVISGVSEFINRLSAFLAIHVITADTFGTVQRMFSGLRCEVVILPSGREDEAKVAFVRKLGAESVVAVGNGRNDRLMLAEAALGIGVIQREGAAASTLTAADLVVTDVRDALEMLIESRRLIATLRC